jgi:hypothetical protein
MNTPNKLKRKIIVNKKRIRIIGQFQHTAPSMAEPTPPRMLNPTSGKNGFDILEPIPILAPKKVDLPLPPPPPPSHIQCCPYHRILYLYPPNKLYIKLLISVGKNPAIFDGRLISTTKGR